MVFRKPDPPTSNDDNGQGALLLTGMNMTSGRQNDTVIDLESCIIATVNDSDVKEGRDMLNKALDQIVGFNGSGGGEEAVKSDNTLDNFAEGRLESGEVLVYNKKDRGALKAQKMKGVMKLKNKGCKKPPKPPLPPRPASLDLADQKLIREISELAALRRERIERMKVLKKIKNGKAVSSSAGNAFALVVTLLFCIVILWQGAFPRHSSSRDLPGSSKNSVGTATMVIP